MSAWNGAGPAWQELTAPTSQPCLGWDAAGASPAQGAALCDGNKGGQLNRLLGGEGLFPKWNFLESMVAVSGLTYSISYSRILFSFRNGMCKIHSHFPSLVIFSFSSLIIQCFLFLGAGCITCGRWQIPASKNCTCFQKYNTLNILKHFSFASFIFYPTQKSKFGTQRKII